MVLIVLVGFILLNLVWFVTTKTHYKPYVEAVPLDVTGVHVMEEEGFTYNVKSPDYLQYTGNLGIVHPDKESALIIWPKLMGEDVYGFRLQKDGEAYEIYLNENLEPFEADERTSELVASKRNEIDEMMSRARKVFRMD